jgi:NADH-quinone oxidoreductase subunit F
MVGDEYAKIGIGKSTGTKLISAGGNINKPGVYEIELGVSVEEFIFSDEYCVWNTRWKKIERLAYLVVLLCQSYQQIYY